VGPVGGRQKNGSGRARGWKPAGPRPAGAAAGLDSRQPGPTAGRERPFPDLEDVLAGLTAMPGFIQPEMPLDPVKSDPNGVTVEGNDHRFDVMPRTTDGMCQARDAVRVPAEFFADGLNIAAQTGDASRKRSNVGAEGRVIAADGLKLRKHEWGQIF
jgi:hypothetical protein